MRNFYIRTSLLLLVSLIININSYAQSGFTDANTGNLIPQLLAVTLENTGSGPSTGGTTYRLYAELAS